MMQHTDSPSHPGPERSTFGDVFDELEKQGAAKRRRALQVAWASVALALAIVAGLIAIASTELSRLEKKLGDGKNELQVVDAAKREAKAELEQTQHELDVVEKQRTEAERARDQAWTQTNECQRVMQEIPPSELKRADAKVAASTPASSTLPRVYLQIVRQEDRAYATKQGKALSSAGFLVLGIENVPAARSLRVAQVRYYKRADAAEAEKIAEILRQQGDPAAKAVPMKDTPKVRPRQYEVWFPAQR